MADPIIAKAEAIAAHLPPRIIRAVMACPFNSKGAGFRGGLVKYNEGNAHLSGGHPPLFVRKQRPDYSGDYSLTPLGLAVRRVLERDAVDCGGAG